MTGIDDRSGQNPRLSPIKDPDSPAGQLAHALRDLVGDRTLDEVSQRANYVKSRISDALSGKSDKVPTLEVIDRICTACDADELTRKRLLDMREAIKSKPPGLVPADPSSPEPASGDPSLPGLPLGFSPPSPSPTSSPVPRGPVQWKWWLVAVCVVVVAAGMLVWRWWPDRCGSGMRLNDNTDGECIGITDGSYLFNDPSTATNNDDRTSIEKINDVEKRIEIENNTVATADRYVHVVLLSPLTVSHDKDTLSTTPLKEILRSLEGSYTALYRVNHSSAFGDPVAVKIRLLLANQGSQQNADPDFLNRIVRASQPGHPVVAVIGLGSSVPTTKTAVEYLTKQGIPLVSAVASADDLTALPLLWSVSPSNAEYADRIHSFLETPETKDTLKSGIIVHDLNPDNFTKTLTHDYHGGNLKPYIKFPDQGFRGATQRGPVTPDVFVPIVTNLCNAANDPNNPLDTVFYAGRAADLKAFTEALKTRICRNRALTILTVTSGFPSVLDSVRGTLQDSNVKVVVATSSDSSSPGYPDFLHAYQNSGFHEEDLDGYAIEHHDALATTAQAIRLATQPTQLPTPEDVAVQLGNLNLSYAVRGASGTLSFQPQGGRATRAPGQPIPIKQIGQTP
jgi:ABC-type branched-subunit amino acid transport system substrate-binding protein